MPWELCWLSPWDTASQSQSWGTLVTNGLISNKRDKGGLLVSKNGHLKRKCFLLC